MAAARRPWRAVTSRLGRHMFPPNSALMNGLSNSTPGFRPPAPDMARRRARRARKCRHATPVTASLPRPIDDARAARRITTHARRRALRLRCGALSLPLISMSLHTITTGSPEEYTLFCRPSASRYRVGFRRKESTYSNTARATALIRHGVRYLSLVSCRTHIYAMPFQAQAAYR